jgi:esterase
MKLHYRLQPAEIDHPDALPIIFIHGLFGTLDNLGVLARDLRHHHPVMQVDMRNHGTSPRDAQMNYAAMAQDVLDTLDTVGWQRVIVCGHSMGGKAAMAMTALAPERIEHLIAIDIAPIDYQVRRHDEIFTAINAVSAAGITDRRTAHEYMRHYLEQDSVIQFLLKSFQQGQWAFNVPVLMDQYAHIVGWQPIPAWQGPTLFICGGASPYVQSAYQPAIISQFPQAKAHVIAGCGHWVHAEKPQTVLRSIHRFLNQPSD